MLSSYWILCILCYIDPPRTTLTQDYGKIDPTDKISVVGLKSFAPGVPLAIEGKKLDGTTYKFPVRIRGLIVPEPIVTVLEEDRVQHNSNR